MLYFLISKILIKDVWDISLGLVFFSYILNTTPPHFSVTICDEMINDNIFKGTSECSTGAYDYIIITHT